MRFRGGIGPLSICLAAALGQVAAATYHVDCAGQDGSDGATSGTAWQSLAKAKAAVLEPGDRLLFKRGCAWTGPLVLDWVGDPSSPIRIGAYGAGDAPVIRDGNPANVSIRGRWMEVESLTVHSKPVAVDPGCADQPVGSRSGFAFLSGSSDNTLRHVLSSGHSMGVWMAQGSRRNRVLRSVIKDNVSLTVNDKANPDNDAGAFGILINGDSNEVAYNTLSNNLAWCSYDYGIDGASVEIYEARGNRIHHNRSLGEGTFTELGGSRTEDNVFAWNLVSSAVEACIFLNVRGAASKWGPNRLTVAVNNTVHLTGSQSQGIVCTGGCAPDILDMRNNIIWTGWKAAYVDGQPREGNNIYWKAGGGPLIQNLATGPSSKRADPLFTNAAGGDYRLSAGSPALDAGDPSLASLGGGLDAAENPAPQGAGLDIGCFERPAGTGLKGISNPLAKTGTRIRFDRGWLAMPGPVARAVDARGARR